MRAHPRQGRGSARHGPTGSQGARRSPSGRDLTIRPARLPLLLLGILAWTLAHPYQGIFHDANLYTLQALSRLYPGSLPHDVFLRFGSQDRFTLFGPLYALAMRWLGVDGAASWLTLVSQAALLAGGWCLARAVMSAEYALLGMVLLVAIPGDYGPARIFTCIEPFLTPRMGGEALVLAALAAAFSGRRYGCLALLVAAFLLHPVMAAAGAVAWLFGWVVVPHRRVGAALVFMAGAWLLLASFSLPSGTWGRMDVDWLSIVTQRSPYLFLSFWQLDDWSRAAVTLTILIIGAITLTLAARRLCVASALTMTGGLLLTWLACDILHLTLFTQMQPWRWQWLGAVVAAIALPQIVAVNWGRGVAGRATALLLLSAWVFGVGEFAIVVCLAALVSPTFARLQASEQRLLFWGSCAALGLAVIWRIASNLEFSDVHYMDAALPLWLRHAESFVRDGVLPAALLCLIVWSTRALRPRIAASAYAVLGIAAIIGLAPFAWSAWTQQEFPDATIARYAAWRDVIAPHDEVFWAESPLSIWTSLHRPSYISGLQTSGMVFSRESALELERRAFALKEFIGPGTFLSWSGTGAHLSLGREALEGICRLGAFNYLVTGVALGMQPVATIDRLKLYRCTPVQPTDQARAAAAAT